MHTHTHACPHTQLQLVYRSIAILLNFYTCSHTEVVQNDLSGSGVVSLKPTSTAMMVTGNLQDMRNKSRDVKESIAKQPLQQATFATILSSKLSNSEDSSHFQQQEELHFLSCIQRQTETFSNLTASKSNSVVSSQVTFSSHHTTANIATKVKSKSISTGMSLLA